MSETFAALAPEYTNLLAQMVINRDQEDELMARAKVILARANQEDYASVIAATGVPKLWAMASFERESSSDYRTSPAQGDRWDEVSIHVPRGLGPYRNWAASAIAAYRIDRLDQVGAGNWSWARGCFEGELFNGFGPRLHGRHTGYLWSWSNIYTGGKYIADGVWSAVAIDQQCGMIPLMVGLLRLDPSLALADRAPPALVRPSPLAASPPLVPDPAPAPAGVGLDVRWLQQRLDDLGASPPIAVDGSYGRETRRAVAAFQAQHKLLVDGLAGPQTIGVMKGLA